MKFVAAGGLRIDYLITPEGEAFSGQPGGNALYAAAGAAQWVDGVALWARYGRNYPTSWLGALAELGLDTRGLIAVDGDQDHRTFYAYLPDGRRDDTEPSLHYARAGVPLPDALRDYIHSTPQQDDPQVYEPLTLRPGDWPASFAQATAVNLSPLPLATHLHIPAELRRQGVQQISVDPGERYMVPQRRDYIHRILPAIDAFLPSDQEVRSLFGQDVDLWQAASTLCEWGAPLVLIKAGADGVYLMEKENGKRVHLHPYHHANDPRIVDVTGAGDAFCGGFMIGLAQSADAITAAQMGLVSASRIIEGYGALYGLKLDQETSYARLRSIRANS
jgi:sugar/nucleoside kinase (ribokinase family)